MNHPTRWVCLLISLSGLALGQAPALRERGIPLEWRRVGGTTVDLGLASPAGGPVDRVWYNADGSVLSIRTRSGKVFQTSDFENWTASPDSNVPPDPIAPVTASKPEPQAAVRSVFGRPDRMYAAGANAFRSDDGGVNWTNVTVYSNRSILGEGLSDLAVSPRDGDEITVAGRRGVWRSLDAGATWTGLNGQLANMPDRRFVPSANGRSLRLQIDDGLEVEWVPGEHAGWRQTDSSFLATESARKNELTAQLSSQITALAGGGDVLYAGSADGRVWWSNDAGKTFQPYKLTDDRVTAIFADARDPQFAVALITGKRTQVARTTNGGRLWDMATENLPNIAAHGITADRASGAVYVATDAGVYYSYAGATPGSPWAVLKSGRANDVMLEPDGNQLYIALDGLGVYASLAPHRLRDPRVVSTADLLARAAAPGALLTVLGTRVQSAHAGDLVAPVLAASDTQSQIQIPFDAAGSTVSVAMESTAGRLVVGLPLQETAPAIVVDPDGSPLIVDGNSGLMLDSSAPARPHSRLQIFSTGLGKVSPEWPVGIAAPASDTPRVVAPVRVLLDGAPVAVTRAVLAPNYVGFYLVEIELPDVVNTGTAELTIESQGRQSNPARIYVAQ